MNKIVLLSAVMLVGACAMDETDSSSVVSLASKGDMGQVSGVYDFTTGAPLQGHAELNRSGVAEGESESIMPAGEVVTMWIVAFNNPAACGGGYYGGNCGLADLGVAEAGATIMWADGIITDDEGEGEFEFDVVADTTNQVILGAGHIDLESAEIHFVARSHGPPIEGQLEAQLTTYGGGCAEQTCTDLSFSVFPAP